MSGTSQTALVVSAHSADFVWRAGGAIALHAQRGVAATVICLSYGVRGESAKLWRQSGMTLERVMVERQKEAEAARNSDKTITYGEGYEAVFPHVVENLA